MSIIWTEAGDSRAMLGPSTTIQENIANFNVSDYPAGGYPVPAQNFGMSRIRALIPCGYTGAARGYVWEYDTTGLANQPPLGVLRVYQQNGTTGALVETASNTDFSALGGSVRLLAFGIG